MSATASRGRLDGKVAVVTGAGSGIGRASSLLFAHEGAKVVCADISGMEDATAAAIGDAAIAVSVAGLSGPRGPLAELDEDAFDTVVAINLKGAFLGMKYAIPAMLASGGGSVISTASASALVGWKDVAAYAAAKGGVVQLTKSVALDYATRGIRVNAICPGMTWTGLAGASAAGDSVPPADLTPPQPLKRWGMPDELASAALFLASDESSFVTGIAMPVDGGYVAR